jgi:mannobiose 2-epimerase
MTVPISDIKILFDKVERELFGNIVPFWLSKTKDEQNSGFYGRISNDLHPVTDAPKSLILNTRILWAFSNLYRYKPQKAYLDMADKAYEFIRNYLLDTVYNGFFWMVDFKGNVLEDVKKMYGQAFSIYALSEYYRVTKKEPVLKKAIEIFHLIESNNFDKVNGGYFEASSRNWQIDRSISLSTVDLNEVKSMNTHLHLMEAYSNLFDVWPDDTLREKLQGLIHNHINHIIDPRTKHFKLFFGEDWSSKSTNVSFGHDIEGSWLLCEAVEKIKDNYLKEKVQKTALDMVEAVMAEGFDNKNALSGEKDENGRVHRPLEWWQQAEAFVGFINAFQISEKHIYMEWALKIWDVIEKFIIDKKYGEWFFGINAAGNFDASRYKVSEWKGPYHNIRACREALIRLKKYLVYEGVKV